MNEIPKNTPNVPQQRIEQVKQPEQTVETTAQPAVQTESKEINEIPENPADRSVVGKVDNLENDLKIFAANPELAKKALEVAEVAENQFIQAGIKDPELKALSIGKAFVEEFQK